MITRSCDPASAVTRRALLLSVAVILGSETGCLSWALNLLGSRMSRDPRPACSVAPCWRNRPMCSLLILVFRNGSPGSTMARLAAVSATLAGSTSNPVMFFSIMFRCPGPGSSPARRHSVLTLWYALARSWPAPQA